MIPNTKIFAKNSTKLKREIFINKKYQRNIAKKISGLSNRNRIIRAKELSCPTTLNKSRVS
jgi:hypothetical protein